MFLLLAFNKLLFAGMTKDCRCIQVNGQSLEITEKVCYLGDTIGVRGGAHIYLKEFFKEFSFFK